MKKLSFFYHTIVNLRFKQVFFRVLRSLRNLKASDLNINTLFGNYSWVWCGPEVVQPSFLGGKKVCFLNLTGHICSAEDWNNPYYEKLWLYNLHYFDDLNAENSLGRLETQLTFVQCWISENPPVSGNGWEPYPLSLRLVNWIKWYRRAGIDNSVIINSIALQAQALSKQLEYHILGNHLFANAKALIFSGCFLKGAEAEHYLQTGLKILDAEIPEQFLEDGGHFELTPMYHCILLWDLLDLINLATITCRSEFVAVLPLWRSVAEKALNWLRVMQHPDGEVSFFNDSTKGIAATPEQLYCYAASLNLAVDTHPLPRLVTLPVSGYSRVSMPEHMLLFDHAAVGPDYLPGHAHADTLSLEWSVGLERVLVNSGTSVYGVSQERLRQRQTAAHNTVEVDNADSSEVWSGFRVARRAYPKLLRADSENGNVVLIASHDGYQRLKGKVTHLREVESTKKNLTISDKLHGNFTQATVHWHLYPEVKIEQLSTCELMLTLCSGKQVSIKCDVPLQVLPSTWHPGFGETISSYKIIANFISDEVNITFSIV